MAAPYDKTFRERVVAAYESSAGTALEVATLFGLSYRTVQRWIARRRSTGSLAATPRAGGWHSPIDLGVPTTVIAEAPGATCAELCRAYNRRVPRLNRTTLTSLWRAMRRAGSALLAVSVLTGLAAATAGARHLRALRLHRLQHAH